ncbi:MAG: hypothetical protein DWQ45_23780 [Planctomycetota bacterium]|nr:MAG: hypothetical protein DWQ41_14740 [Planctomycetota bacterium]REK28732.1 MAG: hypothetical protein DWQ45_23780 [Planctomycetota bacterium]
MTDIHRGSQTWGRRIATILLVTACVACLPGIAFADAAGDYNVALEFYKQDRWEQAARAFREFLTRYSEDTRAPSATIHLGQALVNQRKFDEARDVFRNFATKYKENENLPLARFRIAECSYFLRDDEQALRELAGYLELHPDHDLAGRALLYSGQTQLRLNDPAAAAKSFEALLADQPGPPLDDEATYGLARAREGLGEIDGAAELYRQLAANRDSTFGPDAQFRLGAMHFEAQQFALAAEEFAALSSAFPNHPLVPKAELNAGYANYYLQRYADAITHFQLAANHADFAATAGYWIGVSQKEAGDYETAAATLKALYEQDPDQPLADSMLFHWAHSELNAEDYDEAKRLFMLNVQRWPQGERADDSLHLATEAALRSGQLAEASQFHARFQADYPQSGLYLLQQVLAGRVLLAEGDREARDQPDNPAATERYRAAADLFAEVISGSNIPRTRSIARVQLARAYDRLHQPEQVVETLTPLVAEFQSGSGDPELTESLLLQADNLLALRQYESAVAVCELYLAQPAVESASDAWSSVARAQTHLGNRDAAANALDRLAEVDSAKTRLASATYDCAEIVYGESQWDWAADLYARVVALDPPSAFHAAALSGLGYSQHEAGLHPEAAETFAQLLALQPDDLRLASNAAYMQGISLQLAGETAAAIEAYDAGLEKFSLPGDVEPNAVRLDAAYNAYRCAKGAARLHREAGEVEKSDAAYEAAYQELKRQPEERQSELDKLINEWALLSYENENHARSDELFKLLIEERPDSDLANDAQLYLAESRFFSGDLEEARQRFEQLSQSAEADEFVRHRSSVLLLDIAAQQEDWDALLDFASDFTEQFPESDQRWYAKYRAGEAALEVNQPKLAIAELTPVKEAGDNGAVSGAKWYPSVWVLLAEAFLQEQDYAAVDAIANEMRTKLADSPYLYHMDEVLGRSFKNRAMFEEARAAFTRVIESETGRRTETAARAQLTLAETYLIEKDFETALAEYYKVYVNYMFPKWQAPALYQAAQCDETLKQWEGAAKSYQTLIDEFPESEYAEKAKPRLEVVRTNLTP